MERNDKIVLYLAVLLVLVASFFVKRIDTSERYIPIKGTTKYYYINPKKNKDTVVVDSKKIAKEVLFFIKIGYYD